MNALLERINLAGQGFVDFAGAMFLQSSVLVVILLLVDLVLRRKVRAVFRYCIWMLVLVKLVLPTTLSSPVSLGFLLPMEFPTAQVNETANSGGIQTALPEKTEQKTFSPMSSPVAQPLPRDIEPIQMQTQVAVETAEITWQRVVFVGWMAVVVVMLLLLIQRAMFVRGLIAQAKEASDVMNDTFRFCLNQMGMRGKISLKISPNATSPAVCGLFRPVILVPQELGPNVGANQLRIVLLHELAHVKRGDLWVNLAQTLLQIFYFYNPFLWFANWVIRRVREQAVDETVLVVMGEKASQYPETLVNVAKLAFTRPALSLRLIGVVESKSALSQRVKHMLTRPIPKTAKLGIAGLLAVFILGAFLLPMSQSWAGEASFVVKGRVTDAVKGEPIAGAKVGDVERYAGGKQNAVTDSNGNYSYRTWCEEHNVKAEAAGYKPKKEILLTSFWQTEKEKVLYFALEPGDVSKPKIISINYPSGSEMAMVSALEVVFDQPMQPDQFQIDNASEKSRRFDITTVSAYAVYDANHYRFTIPLILPSNWNGYIKLSGFKNLKGTEAEAVVLQYRTLQKKFSENLCKQFEDAAQSKDLKNLIEKIKNVRSNLKSLSETIHIIQSWDNQQQSYKVVFMMQGSKQFYADISERMKIPFIIGSDGANCWFYIDRRSREEKEQLFVTGFDEIGEKDVVICNLFDVVGEDVTKAIKQNNLEYKGMDLIDGRKCFLVRAWTASMSIGYPNCKVDSWWIDAETYLPVKLVRYGTMNETQRFVFDKINEPIDDSQFRPDFVKGIEPQTPESLDEGYDTRFLIVDDGSASGRMSVRWGKRGSRGTSSSGLN